MGSTVGSANVTRRSRIERCKLTRLRCSSRRRRIAGGSEGWPPKRPRCSICRSYSPRIACSVAFSQRRTSGSCCCRSSPRKAARVSFQRRARCAASFSARERASCHQEPKILAISSTGILPGYTSRVAASSSNAFSETCKLFLRRTASTRANSAPLPS
jgi:hypothetical protein